jgi:Alpha-L-arabinofuranosidase B, catalytic
MHRRWVRAQGSRHCAHELRGSREQAELPSVALGSAARRVRGLPSGASGGTGGAAQIWAGTNGANGGQRIIGGVFDNEDKTYLIVESAATNPVRFEGTEIRVPSASLVLATGGGGATYDDRTRIVYTKVCPVLKTADFLAAAPVALMGLRLPDGNYAGPLIKVRRVDTGATLDIYPTSTGAFDTAAIALHCGAAIGTIAMIYDRAGRNATTMPNRKAACTAPEKIKAALRTLVLFSMHGPASR